jgi:hypothetical protein
MMTPFQGWRAREPKDGGWVNERREAKKLTGVAKRIAVFSAATMVHGPSVDFT